MGARGVRDAEEASSILATPTMDIVIHKGFFDGLKRLLRPWWHPANLWYRFKCWAWHRYTTVKPRYLEHTWCDRTEVLPHMMFEILSQFLEKECSPGDVNWYGECGHKVVVNGKEKYVRDEIQELYDWWHNEYNKSYKELHDKLWQDFSDYSDAHLVSEFDEDGNRTDCVFWNPKYDSDAAKDRADELLGRMNLLERAAANALDRRLLRILAIRHSLWT